MGQDARSWPDSPYFQLNDEVRAGMLRDTLAEVTNPDDIWIFGFGSLMWNPGFKPTERQPVTLRCYERKFHLWSTKGRGSQERPGLGLCLEPAKGSCRGIAYRLSPETCDKDLQYLWDREMTSGVYHPRWLTVELENGLELQVLTWVVNEAHVRYAGPRPAREMARVMAGGKGKYGTCRDYLANTIAEMAKLGERDPLFDEVLSLIDSEYAAF